MVDILIHWFKGKSSPETIDFPMKYQSITHDGSMYAIYGATWIPSIYPLYVSIYSDINYTIGRYLYMTIPLVLNYWFIDIPSIIISTYNPIYRLYNPIEITSYN